MGLRRFTPLINEPRKPHQTMWTMSRHTLPSLKQHQPLASPQPCSVDHDVLCLTLNSCLTPRGEETIPGDGFEPQSHAAASALPSPLPPLGPLPAQPPLGSLPRGLPGKPGVRRLGSDPQLRKRKGREMFFLLLGVMPPSRPVNRYLALAVQQALGRSDGGSPHGCRVVKDALGSRTVVTCG